MADKKFKYRVDSPIKFRGKRREPGDVVRMSEQQAEGVHVTRISGAPAKAAGKQEDPPKEIDISKGSRAHDDWRAVVDFIEATPHEELTEAGFVGKEEDRKSVRDAWEAKQKAANEKRNDTDRDDQ